jgi:hypothetical protein
VSAVSGFVTVWGIAKKGEHRIQTAADFCVALAVKFVK